MISDKVPLHTALMKYFSGELKKRLLSPLHKGRNWWWNTNQLVADWSQRGWQFINRRRGANFNVPSIINGNVEKTLHFNCRYQNRLASSSSQTNDSKLYYGRWGQLKISLFKSRMFIFNSLILLIVSYNLKNSV